MRKKLLFICFLISFSLWSQETYPDFIVDFITTKQGLSHNYVSSIVSDDLNIKWIGTENGITRYDGYNFEYIKPGKEYPELLNENIETLFKDRNNKIWIGTKSGGLSSFDVKTNTVTNYNYLIDSKLGDAIRVISISEDKVGNLWVGTWSRGLFVIDYRNDKLINHYKSNLPVYSVINDSHGNVWYALNKTLYRYNPALDKAQDYPLQNFITNILSDSFRDKIWITTAGPKNTKLFDYDFSTNRINTTETGVASDYTKKLHLDKYHRLWIGTWGNGVYRSDSDIAKFEKIELSSRISGKISANYNTILDIHQDKNNVIWLTTANGGLIRLIEGNGFKNANRVIKNNALKGFLNITAIHKDDDNLYLGTLYSGLYVGKDFSDLKHIDEVDDNQIRVIYPYKQNLFIGTNEGLYRYDLKLKKVTFETQIFEKITSFLVDSSNNLFIGTQQLGLAIVHIDSLENRDRYRIYSENSKANKLKSNRITGIKEDSNGNIWISSYNGLHLYNRDTRTLKYQSDFFEERLPTTIINDIFIKNNNIWLATPLGLFKLRYEDQKLTRIDTINKADGLNSDFICAVTYDKDENLWFSTHTEIVKYNETAKSLISFGELNGVETTSFNNRSLFNYKNQQMYFGGIDNVTFFNPNNLSENQSIPEVIFTNLRVNNQTISFKKNSTFIDENINYENKIVLDHISNSISISFVANDFLGKLNVKYRYKLNNAENNWFNIQDQNEINFAKLSPGIYKFEVEASRDNQNWSQPKTIEIEVRASPWKTPLAYFSYLLTIGLIIFYILKLYNERIKLANNLKIAEIDKRKQLELTEAKLTFFTNISHEFRSPLTLILSPISELLDNKNLSQKDIKNLSFIEKNAYKLLNLINQLLDFRKADYGLLKLSVSQGNFVKFSKEVFLYFAELAREKNIDYQFEYDQEDISFPFDRSKMEIVLSNLLSNAIKFTPTDGQIKMRVESHDGFCFLTVQDSGIGIKPKHLDKIFDRFFQISSSNTARVIGSGIGLAFSKKIIELHHGTISVDSEKNKGTVFTVKLDLEPNYLKSEIDKNFIHTDNIQSYETSHQIDDIKTLSTESKKITLLIIDDNEDILQFINEILSTDYNILMATNGDEGFEIASKELPDLIVSDVMMPGKDGISLCKDLKSQITTSHIPIILLTARTSTIYELEGLKTGADDYITKPFNAKVIKARISSLLENRKILRTHFLNKIRFEPTPEHLQDDNSENTFIHTAIVLVENNLDNPNFGIDDMVEKLNMSQSTLYRKIKSLTGLSITAFIRSIRLKKAAQLILTKDLNLNQIAYEVGFNDYKYFKSSFRSQFDCLPSKYKDKINQSQ
jgi:signal transduction histidine kinase/ligand-binding sensor domain-containing protein/DNA-binding response OmpR family regulator